MDKPNFNDYSLAMFCGGRRVFRSSEAGLKPLVEWLEIYRGKYRGCLLHDKIVGLAAAKLIVYSGLIRSGRGGCLRAGQIFPPCP